MKSSPRLYAALATLLVCCLVLLWLFLARVETRRADAEWPPRHTSEIEIEEFAEIIDLPASAAPAADIPAPAPLDEPQNAQAEPTPQSGHDVSDAGEPAEAPATVTSSKPSPVKAKTEKPKKTGPSAEELKKQKEEKAREEARRRATANTRDAFANAKGKTTPRRRAPRQATPALRPTALRP